jgi:hypothetical protein
MRQSGLTPEFLKPYTAPLLDLPKLLTEVSCCVRPFVFSQDPMRLEACISTTSSRVFAIFFLHPAAPFTLRWEVEVEHAAVSEDCKFVASPLFNALVA